MNVQILKVGKIKLNPNNPKLIKDDAFKKLVQSIIDFPQMLEIRPVVVNKDMMILGGNYRYKACLEAGLTEIPVIIAKDLTPEQEKEFLIKDNISGGEWDWDILANEWNAELLEDWGLDVWKEATEVDYEILDDDDVSGQLDDFTNGVKKAIQIEFEAQDYEQAFELVKFWRETGAYVGGLIIEKLKAEKENL